MKIYAAQNVSSGDAEKSWCWVLEKEKKVQETCILLPLSDSSKGRSRFDRVPHDIVEFRTRRNWGSVL